MEEVRLLLENSPRLSEPEKLEIVNLGWLFAHAPRPVQARAAQRIYSLLGGDHADADSYMRTVREVATDLNRAIDERVERRRRTAGS